MRLPAQAAERTVEAGKGLAEAEEKVTVRLESLKCAEDHLLGLLHCSVRYVAREDDNRTTLTLPSASTAS